MECKVETSKIIFFLEKVHPTALRSTAAFKQVRIGVYEYNIQPAAASLMQNTLCRAVTN